MRIKVFSILLLILSLNLMTVPAQNTASDKIRPQWVHKLPEPTNSTFRYEIISANASSLEDARNKCLSELIASSGLSHGVVVSSDYVSNEKVSQVWKNGKLSETINYDSHTTTSSKSEEIKLFIENIDEYWNRDNNGNYYLKKLYAKSELSTTPLFDNVELTTKYGIHGLWRSVIVPGWGQLYKGSTLKGSLILGGTAVLVGGIIFTENQRVDYIKKINKTHSADIKRAYATRSDNFTTGRNICVGAVAALYVYNLIDAIVAPGARRVIVKERTNRKYAITPTISFKGEPSIMASVTF